MDDTQMDSSEMDLPIIEPDEKKMVGLVSSIQKKLGLDLLGIDVIIENGTGRYGVIDINAFPGYDGVDEFFPSLLELIQNKMSDIPVAPHLNDCDALLSDDHRSLPISSSTSGPVPSSDIVPTDNVIGDLDHSSTKWCYFSQDFCTPCSLSEHQKRPEASAGVVEQTVAINSCNGH